MYSLNGQLINGNQAYQWLLASAKKENDSFTLSSAFIISNVLENLAKSLSPSVKVKVLARWQLNDLLAGASDLDSYNVAKKYGWEFHISKNFHGKVYSFSNEGVIVGSANATNNGFGLSLDSNSEVCTVVKSSPEASLFINGLFKNSLLVTDEVFEKIKAYYDDNKVELVKKKSATWPEELDKLIYPVAPIGKLLLSECFFSDGADIFSKNVTSDESLHDCSLLSALPNVSESDYIAEQFKSSKMYFWLKKLLDDKKILYYGAISDALHNDLLQDPKIYRSEVKNLLSNLISWIEILGPAITGIAVDRPNYSQRLSLVL